MFGKEQPDVVTDDDVGNYVKQLEQEGESEIDTFIKDKSEDTDGVDNSSGKPTDGAENTE